MPVMAALPDATQSEKAQRRLSAYFLPKGYQTGHEHAAEILNPRRPLVTEAGFP